MHSGFSMITCLPARAAASVDAMVQEVGQADVHDLAVRLGNRAIEVGEPLRDAASARQRAAARSGDREYTAVTCASGTKRLYDSRWMSAMKPAPRIATVVGGIAAI